MPNASAWEQRRHIVMVLPKLPVPIRYGSNRVSISGPEKKKSRTIGPGINGS